MGKRCEISRFCGIFVNMNRTVGTTAFSRTIFLPLFLLAALSGCAIILGSPDDAADVVNVRIRYVETLRNPSSLTGGQFLQSGILSLPTSSLQQPTSVAADAFRVYVTDQHPTPRLAIFDRTARMLKIYSAPTPTELGYRFLDLTSVAIADSGEIFIADGQQGKVFCLDREARIRLTIGQVGSLAYPSSVAVDSRRQLLYVADKHARLLRIYRMNGDWVRDVAGGRDADNRLRAPVGIALDASGTVFVLDAHDQRIHVIGNDGVWQQSFPIQTDRLGETVKPTGIALDSDGHLYVTDTFGNAILLFDGKGAFLQRWSGLGSQGEGFWMPSAIFIDSRDFIYVADRMNGRIQVYQYEK